MKNHYVVEVEEFIADNRHGDVAWPCVYRTAANDPSRVRLLLCGDLVVDLPVRVAGRITPQFVSRWHSGEAPNCEWDFGRPSPGGFVGQAAPIAANLGCDVHIATVIPLPTPALIRTFLECRSFDSRNVVACLGPAPVSVRFRFTDRCVAITYPGVSSLATPRIPSNPGETFDVILADAGWPEGRPARLESLVESCRRGNRELQLGIVGRGDLSAAELRLLSRKHCWLFLSEAAAREVAARFRQRRYPAWPYGDSRGTEAAARAQRPSRCLFARHGNQPDERRLATPLVPDFSPGRRCAACFERVHTAVVGAGDDRRSGHQGGNRRGEGSCRRTPAASD